MLKRKVKKNIIFALCLYFALCTKLFAAVVADNDGSAFITKTEYDSMRNDFQSQLDSYNNNIDSKIDYAIASYLSGIIITKEDTLMNGKSVLKYPLKMQMKNSGFDWTRWDTNGAIPYWAPNLNMYIWGRRGSCTFLVNKLYTLTVANKKFYNGEWDIRNNKYRIDGMLDDVKGELNFNTNYYNYLVQHANETDVTFGFCLDQSSNFPRQNHGTAWTSRASRIRSSGSTLVDFYSGSTSYSSNIMVEAIWNWGGKAALSIRSTTDENEDYLNEFKAANTAYFEGNNPGNVTFDSSLSYKTYNTIDFIMNAYDSDRTDTSGKRIELPVAYNNHIYLTNKNNFKEDLQGGTIDSTTYKNGYKQYSDSQDGTTYRTKWWFANMISPGWTLEPQFSGYSLHSIYQRSLMEPQNMYYVVKMPYSKKEIVNVMNEGILLTEASKDYKLMNIKINIASENPGIKKYLVMSHNPITQSDYTAVDTEESLYPGRYIKISEDKNLTNLQNKYELKEGENSLFIGQVSKDKYICYKILWDKNNSTYVNVVSEPSIVGEYE